MIPWQGQLLNGWAGFLEDPNMCTLIVARDVFDANPLVIAANRDEFLSRPAGSFRLWEGTTPGLFAPVDLKAGGTWLGINDSGVVAAITNRFGTPPDPSRKSRGELVPLALKGTTVVDALARVAAESATDFNPFHLLIADRSEAVVIWSDGHTTHQETCPPGFTIITERSYGESPPPREMCLDALLTDVKEPGELAGLLAFHHPERSIDGICVHAQSMGYGTRSSTIIALGDHAPRLRHTDAPPCQVSHEALPWPFAH
jgi:uncharacterized protein with NRDE domain